MVLDSSSIFQKFFAFIQLFSNLKGSQEPVEPALKQPLNLGTCLMVPVAPLGISIDGFPSSEYPIQIIQKTFKSRMNKLPSRYVTKAT